MKGEEMGAESVSLDEISIDGGTQQREIINVDVVGEYAEMMLNGEVFPPVNLYWDGVTHWLADGFHRYHASRKAGFTDISAVIHKGTMLDAILCSYTANAKHGLRRTPADKRKIVMGMLGNPEWTLWADRDIAIHCHVSHTFVSKLRKEITKKSTPSKKKLKDHNPNGNVASKPEDPASTKPKEPAATPAKASADDEHFDPNETRVAELASAVNDLAQENEKLKDIIAVGQMDSPEIDGCDALETLTMLRARVVDLEREVETLRASRDSYQMETAELKRQCARQRREIEKLKKA